MFVFTKYGKTFLAFYMFLICFCFVDCKFSLWWNCGVIANIHEHHLSRYERYLFRCVTVTAPVVENVDRTSETTPTVAVVVTSLCTWYSVCTLPRPFTPDLKFISFTNPFLRSLLIPSRLPSRILNLYWTNWALAFVSFSFMSWSHLRTAVNCEQFQTVT